VICVCGASELKHRVSELYSANPAARPKLVTAQRRGVEAIADEISRYLMLRAA
jgi:hypothetical protein